MTNIKIVLTIILLTSFFISTSSCKKEDKEYTSISGQWRCDEQSPMGMSSFTIDIENSTHNSSIYAIYNINNKGHEERAFATLKDDSLIIESQFIGNTMVDIEGYGIITEDYKLMTLYYTTKSNEGVFDINAACTHM